MTHPNFRDLLQAACERFPAAQLFPCVGKISLADCVVEYRFLENGKESVVVTMSFNTDLDHSTRMVTIKKGPSNVL